MGESSERGFYPSQHHRDVRIELFQYLRVDDGRVVGAQTVPAVGAVGIFVPQSSIGRVAVYHRVHGSRSDSEEEPGLSQFLEIAIIAMPIGLWHDGYLVPTGLDDAAYDGCSECRMVYVGIPREEDDVKLIPSSELAFLLGGGQEVCQSVFFQVAGYLVFCCF